MFSDDLPAGGGDDTTTMPDETGAMGTETEAKPEGTESDETDEGTV